MMPDTFGAVIGINLIDDFTLGNGSVWAFGFTDITIDTFVGDQKGHNLDSGVFGQFQLQGIAHWLRDKSGYITAELRYFSNQ